MFIRSFYDVESYDTSRTMKLGRVFIVNFEHISIVDFKQANVNWGHQINLRLVA